MATSKAVDAFDVGEVLGGDPATLDANEVIGLDAVEQLPCLSCTDPQPCTAGGELAEHHMQTTRGLGA